jgi:F1F0 ATPase subunit 2
MNELVTLVLAWGAGALIGGMFFAGLWWTVRHGATSRQPAVWFGGSLLLRMSIALTGFYFVSGRQWDRLLVCLLGFVMARVVVTRLTRASDTDPPHEARRAS